jgi:hypothetical protein
VVIDTTPEEAFDYLAAYMDGGLNQLKAVIRQKEQPMSDQQYDNTDRLYMERVSDTLWKGFNNESFLGGVCRRAFLERLAKPTEKVFGSLFLDLGKDKTPMVLPVFFNEKDDDKREPGTSTDTHWVNFYANQNGSISIAFKAKAPKADAQPAAEAATASGPIW